jgi:hypothetical protein
VGKKGQEECASPELTHWTDEVSVERVLDGRRDLHRIIELGFEDEPEAADEG